jgi:RHS repeat-associated protein
VGADATSVGEGSGHLSPASPTGTFAATVPLELPSPRAALPVPLSIQYTGDARVGAAGIGWDIPKWHVRRSKTTWHRKPALTGSEDGDDVADRLFLSMDGTTQLMVPGDVPGLYLPFASESYFELWEDADGFVLSTSAGFDCRFSGSADGEYFGLTEISDRAATDRVVLDYDGFDLRSLSFAESIDGTPLYVIELVHEPWSTLVENGADVIGETELYEGFVVERRNVITRIDVKARNNLEGSFPPWVLPLRTVRSYHLSYEPDPATWGPRLVHVEVSGEEESGVPRRTLAKYHYTSFASAGGSVRYAQPEPVALDPALDSDKIALATSSVENFWSTHDAWPERVGSHPNTDIDTTQSVVNVEIVRTESTIRDFTGDGVPDLVFRDGGTWFLRKGVARDYGFSLADGPLVSWASSGPPEIHVARTSRFAKTRFRQWRRPMITSETLVAFLDWNGDGRLDIIDARAGSSPDPTHWRLWLNRPGPDGLPAWESEPRSIYVGELLNHLSAQGVVLAPYRQNPDMLRELPLERSRSWPRINVTKCWEINDDGTQGSCDHEPPEEEEEAESFPQDTASEWALADMNGDAFPDVVASSMPVIQCESYPDEPHCEYIDTDTRRCIVTTLDYLATASIPGPLSPEGDCRRLDDDGNLFENAAVVLLNRAGPIGLVAEPFVGALAIDPPRQPFTVDQGISRWVVGLTVEVMGDDGGSMPPPVLDMNVSWRAAGLLDRKGHGRPSYHSVPTYATDELAGSVEAFASNRHEVCDLYGIPASMPFQTTQIEGIVDLDGNGVPDNVYRDAEGDWHVRFGTTAGFAGRELTIRDDHALAFAISETEGECGATDKTRTLAGLIDLDGDGKPEVVRAEPGGIRASRITTVSGPNESDNAEGAGRLTAIENAWGARTVIEYENNKKDPYSTHDVPVPEIVVARTYLEVDGVMTGAVTRNAYGHAEMRYDPISGRQRFTGYRRSLTIVGEAEGAFFRGSGLMVDRRPQAPYGAGYSEVVLGGRVETETQLEGLFVDPRFYLGAPTIPDLVRGGRMYAYAVKDLPHAPWTPGSEGVAECIDVHENGTLNWSEGPWCHRAGIVYPELVLTWEGSESPLDGTSNVSQVAAIDTVDELGRPIDVVAYGDFRHNGDDRCIRIKYAEPVAGAQRTTSAVSSVTTTDCGRTSPDGMTTSGGSLAGTPIVIAAERYRYDGLPQGEVAVGQLTSRIVSRYDPGTGELLGEHRSATLEYDALGRVARAHELRVLGSLAFRTTSYDYDDFGASAHTTTTIASDVPGTLFVTKRDVSTWPSIPVVSTSLNGEQSVVHRDGFGRPLRHEVVSGSEAHVVSQVAYDDDAERRRITRVSYPAGEALPQTSVSHFDELGRPTFTQIELGADYGEATVVTDLVEYDALGRVAWRADPFEAGPGEFDPESLPEDPASWPHGVATVYDAGGRVQRVVEAPGMRPSVISTSVAAHTYVRQFRYFWKHGRAFIDAFGPRDNDPTSASYDYFDREERTALGWTLESARMNPNNERRDLVRRGFDRLGRETKVTRYKNPGAVTEGLVWSRRYDSTGLLLTVQEPGTTPVTHSYDEWGALIESRRSEGLTQRITRQRYDALGRMTLTEIVDAVGSSETIASSESYHYDTHSGSTHQPASALLGRVSWVEATNVGSVYFAYDALGRKASETHLYTHHGDPITTAWSYEPGGALRELAFETPAISDRILYELDSAARTRRIERLDTPMTLFDATVIDALGRYREVDLGNGVRESFDYRAEGRRELLGWSAVTTSGTRGHSYGTRDGDGRLLDESFDLGGAKYEAEYEYDVLGRLTQAAVLSPGPACPITGCVVDKEAFSYDALGNLTAKRNTVLPAEDRNYSYQASDFDRLCRFYPPTQGQIGCAFSHDGAGNVVVDKSSAAVRTFGYDAASRVTRIDKAPWSAEFVYGPGGALVSTQVKQAGVLRQRTWSFGGLVEERLRPNGQSHIERRIPGPLGIVATLRSQGAIDETVFVHGDPRGNRIFTQGDGTITQEVRYAAYGKVRSDSGEPTSITHSDDLWNGGDDLRDLGVVRLGARIYDPTLGRFLQRDPFRNTAASTTANPYGFAWNDPVNLADPSGLWPTLSWGLVGNLFQSLTSSSSSSGAAQGGGSSAGVLLSVAIMAYQFTNVARANAIANADDCPGCMVASQGGPSVWEVAGDIGAGVGDYFSGLASSAKNRITSGEFVLGPAGVIVLDSSRSNIANYEMIEFASEHPDEFVDQLTQPRTLATIGTGMFVERKAGKGLNALSPKAPSDAAPGERLVIGPDWDGKPTGARVIDAADVERIEANLDLFPLPARGVFERTGHGPGNATRIADDAAKLLGDDLEVIVNAGCYGSHNVGTVGLQASNRLGKPIEVHGNTGTLRVGWGINGGDRGSGWIIRVVKPDDAKR